MTAPKLDLRDISILAAIKNEGTLPVRKVWIFAREFAPGFTEEEAAKILLRFGKDGLVNIGFHNSQKFYSLTPAGSDLLLVECQQLEKLVDMVIGK